MSNRRHVAVRMAKNDDGPELKRLSEALDFFQWDNFEFDWSDIEPSWLVGEHGGRIICAIQVAPAKPIGRIECLMVDPSLGLMMRYAATKAMVEHGVALNYTYGAQAVSSLVPSSLPSYMETALERDWFELDEGSIVMRRLR